ncbi:Interferon-induced very large GTPase 1-like [Oopsacas minuta]|uniref:Interferon-induced very large GTPase 1-like n=1 Tax=Oopsacas minuta TaxID=111878 RepID=A0AAV7JZX2_9METZ|nr:Interferon-induced very large GTPase 1-like [Oopsacas minuta]
MASSHAESDGQFPGTVIEPGSEADTTKIPINPEDTSFLEGDENDISTEAEDLSVVCEETSVINPETVESSQQIEFNISQLNSPHFKNCSVQAKGYIELHELLNLDQNQMLLGLTHYISGISIKRQDIDTRIPHSLANLTQVMLQKIILEDASSRKIDIPEFVQDLPPVPASDDLDSFFDSIGGEAITETGREIHPMDIFLLLYLSIDPLFQRKILKKLDKCKLSLPLIVLDPSTCQPKIFAFPFRSLSSEWKKDAENEKARESILFNEPMPIISFIRFGRHSSNEFSKSKILNDILEFDHDCFLHCNSPGSTKSRLLLDGTVELSWYLPRNKAKGTNAIANPITFLNLRGNAAQHLKQLKFLQTISNKIFLFFWSDGINETEIDSLRNLYDKSSSKIVCVFPALTADAKQILKSCPNVKADKEHTIVLGRSNWSKDIDNFCGLINLHSQNTPVEDLCSLATHVFECDHGIDLDCNASYIKETEAEICLILKQLIADSNQTTKDPMRFIKEKYFPLQSKPWEDWSKYYAESIRLKKRGDQNIEKYKSELRDKMNECRQSQMDHLLDKTRSNFLYELLRICNLSFVKPFHTELLWNKLGLELNAICGEQMPALYQAHKDISKVLHSSLADDLNKKELRKLENDYLESAKNLSKSSLGIEHIFREFSQVYESFIQASLKQRECINTNFGIDFCLLPKFAANILVQGYPIEILDGDASHVPIVWLSQVLHELETKIGNKRLYIISILGVQSSGKSTLLNTMFGLHFAVSAGRCTKGIFMQMIPVAEDIIDTLGYDYLVVLDTEGLRAPELDSKTSRFHDNELATFAIGLSHLTIINIMGEASTEIEDILPIAIHAFLRMKLTWIKPKCVFVHQNVTSIGSNEKLGPARAALIHKLNEMTCAAAKLENKSSTIKRFSDLIEFHPDEDVLYFPALFRGDPPMAPVNSSYSANAFDLKLRILQILKLNLSFKPKSISSLITSITQLWAAILNENFVFHFQNVQEINASRELDNAVNMWQFEFSKKISTWQMGALNQLSNCSVIYQTLQELFEDLNQVSLEFCREEEYKIIDDFFDPANPMYDIFSQWQQRTVENFKYTREKLRNLTNEKCKKEGESIENHRKLLDGFDKIESKLIQCTKVFFENHKDSESLVSKQKIQERFDGIWAEWVASLGIKEIAIEKRNVSEDLYRLLFNDWTEFTRFRYLNRQAIYYEYKGFKDIGMDYFYIEHDHFTLHYHHRTIDYFPYVWNALLRRKGHIDNTTRELITTFYDYLNYFSKKCDDIFRQFDLHHNYNPLLFVDIAKEVKKILHGINVDEHSIGSPIYYEFSPLFQFDMTFYQCCRAIPHLEEIQDKFIQKYSIQFHLTQSKAKFHSIFQNLTESIQTDMACAVHLARILLEGMTAYMVDKLNISVVETFFQDNYQRFRNKAAIQFSILEELCLSRKFYQHIKYIKRPNYYIRNWVSVKLQNYIEQSYNFEKISKNMKKVAEFLQKDYISHANDALDASKDWDNWKSEFHKRICKYIKDVRLVDLDILDTYAVENVVVVCANLSEQLEKQSMNFGWTHWIKSNLGYDGPFNTLMDNLLQCQACCPLCNEPCQLSSGSHEKHYCGSLHRVPAVNGRRNPRTRVMSIDQCTIGVRDDLVFQVHWREYRFREFYKAGSEFCKWRILADDAVESIYWQWFTYQFESVLLKRYNYLRNPDLGYWGNYSQREVLLNLKEHFDLISP